MDPIATARYGLMAASRRFETAAVEVSRMGGDEPVDVEGAMVDMIQSKAAFSANLSVIEFSQDMWDSQLKIQRERPPRLPTKKGSLAAPLSVSSGGDRAYLRSVGSEPSVGAPVPDEPMNSFLPSGNVTSRPLALQAGRQSLSFDW